MLFFTCEAEKLAQLRDRSGLSINSVDTKHTISEWTFTALGAVGVMLLVWMATQKYGLGVSSDSSFYLSAADNFSKGRGFIDFEGNPLLLWPPLYPFLISVVSQVSGLSLLSVSRLLNTIAYGLVVLCSAILFKRCFKDRALWFFLGISATILFLPLLTTAANVSTDLIFIWLEVIFFLAASDFLLKKTPLTLLLLSILIALATILRWVGYLMILTEIVLIVIVYWGTKKKVGFYSLVFGGIAALPFAAWAFGINYLRYHSFFGPRDTGLVSLQGNILLTYAKINRWLFPNNLTQRVSAILIWLVFLAILIMINRRKDWLRWARKWITEPILPIAIFSLLYYSFITLTIYTQDHLITAYYDDRLQAPLFFVCLIGGFITIDELILSHVPLKWKALLNGFLVLIFVVWSLYPITLIYKFTKLSIDSGVVAYNLYNNKEINESGLVEFIKTHQLEMDIPLYSNTAEAVYLITGRPVKPSPMDRKNYYARPETLISDYPHWPGVPRSYLIWFYTNQKRNYYLPQDLKQISTLKKLYDGQDGQIFIASPK